MTNPPGFVPEFGQGLRANPQQPGTEGGKDWLKRQKLHKYWPMFSHWSYSDFMSISEENIREKIQEIGATGMTNGAQGRLVRCIKILNDRENVLLATQRAVRANELFIADALLYLMEVVRTPLPTDPSYTISSTIIITYAEVKAYIASRKGIKYKMYNLVMSNLEELIERRPTLKTAMNLSVDMKRHDWHRQEDLPGNKELYRRRILTEDSGYEEMITNPTEKPVENNSKWIVHPSGRPSGADSPGYEAHKYSQLARNIGTHKKYPQSYNYFHNFGSNGSNDTKSYPDTSAHNDLGQLHIKSYRITKSESYLTLGKEQTNISKPFEYNTSPIIKKTPNSYQNPVNRYQVKSNKAYNQDDISSVLRSNLIGIKTDPQIYTNAAGAIPKKSYQEKSFKKTDKNEGYKLSFPNPALINRNERKDVANLYKESRKNIYPPNVPGYPSGMMPHWEVPSAERLYQPNITSSYPALNRNLFNTRPSTPHSNEMGGIGSGCFYDLSPREYLWRHRELIPPGDQTWKPLEFKQHVATNTNEGNWRNLVQFGDNNMASRTYFIDSNKPETNNLLNTTSMLVTEMLEKVLEEDHVNQ